MRSVSSRLRTLREDLAITEEQLIHMVDDADDARLRALVSDDPAARPDGVDAVRHADALRRHRDDVRAEIARLEIRQDELLDELGAS